MKLFAMLHPIGFGPRRIILDRWRNYSPKFYTGDHDSWGWRVVPFYNDMSYVVVF